MRTHWHAHTSTTWFHLPHLHQGTLSFLRLHACGWVFPGRHVSDAWCVTGPKSCALIGQCIADSRVELGKARTLVESDLKGGTHWRHLLGLIHFLNRIRFPVADSKLVFSCLKAAAHYMISVINQQSGGSPTVRLLFLLTSD